MNERKSVQTKPQTEQSKNKTTMTIPRDSLNDPSTHDVIHIYMCVCVCYTPYVYIVYLYIFVCGNIYKCVYKDTYIYTWILD